MLLKSICRNRTTISQETQAAGVQVHTYIHTHTRRHTYVCVCILFTGFGMCASWRLLIVEKMRRLRKTHTHAGTPVFVCVCVCQFTGFRMCQISSFSMCMSKKKWKRQVPFAWNCREGLRKRTIRFKIINKLSKLGLTLFGYPHRAGEERNNRIIMD